MRALILFFFLPATAGVGHAQWVQTNGSYGGDVACFAVNGTNLFAGTWGGGVYLSTNNGANWTTVNNSLSDTIVYTLTVTGTSLFAGTGRGGVFLSTNSGTSWTAVNIGLTESPVFALAVSSTNLFAGTFGDGIFLSTNNGTSWTAVNNSPYPYVYAFAVSPNGAGDTNLFVGTDFGGVFLSTNNGTSWIAVNNGLTNTHVHALAVSSTNLFAGTGGDGIFLSTNSGTSWTHVLGNTTVDGFAVCGTNLFAGTFGGGVFLSTNNGASWTTVNNGLTNPHVHSLSASDTNLFAGTSGGIWRRPLSEMIMSAEQIVDQVPGRYVLNQNYPNPFNPSTTIRYALPHASFVTLTIYNTLGQQVAQPVNEQQQPGYHEVVFRGDGVASGVYFYRLEAGGFVSVKKLLLLK